MCPPNLKFTRFTILNGTNAEKAVSFRHSCLNSYQLKWHISHSETLDLSESVFPHPKPSGKDTNPAFDLNGFSG